MKLNLKDLLRNAIYFSYKTLLAINTPIQNIIEYKRKEVFYSKFKYLGQRSIIPKQSAISNPQFISIGDDFNSLYNLRIDAINEYKGFKYNPSIIIGNNVCLNSDCHIGAIDKIVIGDNVLMGSRVLITDHSHGDVTVNDLATIPLLRQLHSKGPVIIEDNVWIGEGACILPGVTIGKNAIIGANSVVTGNVPANSVVGGIPAKVLKHLI